MSKNTTYEAGDTQVRQTDKAGNKATFEINSKVVVDNMISKYQSTIGGGNIIILVFSEDLSSM